MGGGGELGGPNKKNKFPGERSHRRTRSGGGGGGRAGPKKNLQI